ncbi:DNA damage-regulated autophagy modulator protein 2 [Aethina tumida]|uniref:DNA damage-regulated autophagy modulator protein 2 n=1 Tax=Aethina tumida TaxID=116153 RepID=UPI0021497B1C|nr:DNA damage-regulated autophagy modulator protein 2 [Aethina tumida]XP_049820999.1 DNA damage-regulated autophagy modulator protein 2 [Aethina tumida]
MVFRHAYIFPITVGVWFIFTFLLTYGIAVLNDDVVPVFPYISDTGTWAPESCIFGLMLNLGALIMAVTIYIRYRQVREISEKNNVDQKFINYNTISLYLGYLAAFGICIVGNFQETNVFSVHVMGALLCFGLGFVFQCLQTRISFALYPIVGSKSINIIRLICSLICTLTFLITFIFAGLSIKEFTGEDKTKWNEEDGGYTLHFVSTVAEWILAIFTMIYIVTFTKEFKTITIKEPEITV